MEYEPYGRIRSCLGTYMIKISAIVSSCQRHVPMVSIRFLLEVANTQEIEVILQNQFPPLSDKFDGEFYDNHILRLKQLRAINNELATLPVLWNNVCRAIQSHGDVSAQGTIHDIFAKLHALHAYIDKMREYVQSSFAEVLDANPRNTERQLVVIMGEVRSFCARITHITNFWYIIECQPTWSTQYILLPFQNTRCLPVGWWWSHQPFRE